ncbi:MAG: di-trans,poly-cis-decaprenylcistransferase [Gemmatimonadetes bacterium]|nr:di-trans,poly-cis-decaprenylcistransferase [Gemmatimonadota bacterium]MBT8402561.1 di-trans,poly-cis-decaprenylcistransferase [Gemmatimonadota bacterium]NNK62596.1 di-trans,poly-cis-decaprenylcistransferase [Gemmatimonadota bacterium]
MSSDALERLRLCGVLPRHVAVIMDGNGRWAVQRGLPRHAGHRQGMNAVREAVEGARQAGLKILTLFAFSTENWHRPSNEIGALMGLLRLYAEKEKRELRRQGVEVQVLGELHRLDQGTRNAVDAIVEGTRGGDKLRLNLMISYSGREELLRAVRMIARDAAAGRLDPESIDETALEQRLFTAGMPDPDLLIRTSGELRISNFLLWQLAYTEMHVSPVLWPDFTREHLFEAVLDYQGRERRFGRVTAGE